MNCAFYWLSILLLQFSVVNGGFLNFVGSGGSWSESTKDKDLKDDFQCPDTGNYPVPGDDNCNRYFYCATGGKKRPAHIKECSEKEEFNRLSRDCQSRKHANCELCEKKGLITDLTSKKHFIVCTKALIGIRYKCQEGNYDHKAKRCDSVKEKEEFDPEDKDHAKKDNPKDIDEFEENWREKEKEKEKKDKEDK